MVFFEDIEWKVSMSFCSEHEYNLAIDQSLYKPDFPSHIMTFLSAHLPVTCTKYYATETIQAHASFLPTPRIRDLPAS